MCTPTLTITYTQRDRERRRQGREGERDGGAFKRRETKHYCKVSIANKKRAKKPKTTLNNENRAGGITIPDFNLYYYVIVIKQYITCIETDLLINRKDDMYKPRLV